VSAFTDYFIAIKNSLAHGDATGRTHYPTLMQEQRAEDTLCIGAVV